MFGILVNHTGPSFLTTINHLELISISTFTLTINRVELTSISTFTLYTRCPFIHMWYFEAYMAKDSVKIRSLFCVKRNILKLFLMIKEEVKW
jgi:hypothetical protein